MKVWLGLFFMGAIGVLVGWAATKKYYQDELSDLRDKYDLLKDQGMRKLLGIYPAPRKLVRFLDPKSMPQARLDEEIAKYQDEGWNFDKEYSVNGLLAFYKREEPKED